MAPCRTPRWTAALLLSSLLAGAHAYPALFVTRIATTCTEHPRQAYSGGRGGGHLAPQRDPTVSFQVSSGGKQVAKLCPGSSYSVKVSFELPRYALLTSTTGAFAEGDPWDCPNRVLFDTARLDEQTATLNVPCKGNPASALLEVTSSDGEEHPFLQATATLPVDAACAAAKCAAAAAKGASATAAGKGGNPATTSSGSGTAGKGTGTSSGSGSGSNAAATAGKGTTDGKGASSGSTAGKGTGASAGQPGGKASGPAAGGPQKLRLRLVH